MALLYVLDHVIERLAPHSFEPVALERLHELAANRSIVFDYIDEGHAWLLYPI